MGDFLVLLVACVAVTALVGTLMYGVVRGLGRLLYGPRVKEPAAPARIDRRGPRGPLRPPSRSVDWQAKHARPRRRDLRLVAADADPDCLVVDCVIPERPDKPPVWRDPDATAELSIPRELVEENAA
ncbi:hypothetical protein OG216_09920 [Streptomycetaceae bacterium NBC_01309]